MYDQNNYLQISGIQHFIFCKRQWGLIHIDNVWDSNKETILGDIFHDNVDNKTFESRKDLLILRQVKLTSKKYGVNGIADVVEAVKDNSGINLLNKPGLWRLYPIEYKVGKSKIDNSDRGQLCLQALCLEEMYDIEIPVAYIYYGRQKRREEVLLDNDLREFVVKQLEEMHYLYENNILPLGTNNNCYKCSLKEHCHDKITKLDAKNM